MKIPFRKKLTSQVVTDAYYSAMSLNLWKQGAAAAAAKVKNLQTVRKSWANVRKTHFKDITDLKKIKKFADSKLNPMKSKKDWIKNYSSIVGSNHGRMLEQNLKEAHTGFRKAIKERRKFAKMVGIHSHGLERQANKNMPTGSQIDRVVNARAKGITFRRINGRIVPIRSKK